MEPKGSNSSHKGTQMSPKGAKGLPKVMPKSIKMAPRVATPKKVDLGGSNALSLGPFWGSFWGQKCIQKSMRNLLPKKRKKHIKFEPKTSRDSNP